MGILYVPKDGWCWKLRCEGAQWELKRGKTGILYAVEERADGDTVEERANGDTVCAQRWLMVEVKVWGCLVRGEESEDRNTICSRREGWQGYCMCPNGWWWKLEKGIWAELENCTNMRWIGWSLKWLNGKYLTFLMATACLGLLLHPWLLPIHPAYFCHWPSSSPSSYLYY